MTWNRRFLLDTKEPWDFEQILSASTLANIPGGTRGDCTSQPIFHRVLEDY